MYAGVEKLAGQTRRGQARGTCSVLDSFFRFLEQVGAWIQNDVAVQVDPLASTIAVIALVVAARANRRSAKMLADERSRAGNISKIAIHEHSMQAVFEDRSRSPQTAPRDAGEGEGFVCSVYSGDTEVEVESVYLKIVFVEGMLARRRWEVRVDIQASEGLAMPATSLPFRMQPNSRLDYIFPTFVTFFSQSCGKLRKMDVTRFIFPSEQLCFEFGAYSRVSQVPITALRWHRLGSLGIPLRWAAPWTKVVKYPSLWDALTSDTCPDSLRGWFLEWLECRVDFDQRVAGDPSLRNRLHEVVYWHYWPVGKVAIGGARVAFGDPGHDPHKHRLIRAVLARGGNKLIDRGRTVSGPGGSSEFSQFRLSLVLALLSGAVAPSELSAENSQWPRGLSIKDALLESAVKARRLGDIRNRKQLTQSESDELAEHLSSIGQELSRCTYMPTEDCEEVVSQALQGALSD